MSERLQQLLEQVYIDGVVDRAWKSSAGDVEKFKIELLRTGVEAGYVFEVEKITVVDGKPVAWPSART